LQKVWFGHRSRADHTPRSRKNPTLPHQGLVWQCRVTRRCRGRVWFGVASLLCPMSRRAAYSIRAVLTSHRVACLSLRYDGRSVVVSLPTMRLRRGEFDRCLSWMKRRLTDCPKKSPVFPVQSLGSWRYESRRRHCLRFLTLMQRSLRAS
jgi:hypothetical protein